uniref:Uncharacterized protein n=1 Tax=Kalanchoe fedtschenkoi TaxID=63787 RepID=A0A7N0UMP9_KALFE
MTVISADVGRRDGDEDDQLWAPTPGLVYYSKNLNLATRPKLPTPLISFHPCFIRHSYWSLSTSQSNFHPGLHPSISAKSHSQVGHLHFSKVHSCL